MTRARCRFAFLALPVLWSCSGEDAGRAPANVGTAGSSSAGAPVASGGTAGAAMGGAPAGSTSAPDISIGGASQGGRSDVANGECAQLNFQSSRKPVDVLLLLDRSASMEENDIAPGVTRWDGVVPVVNRAVTATDSTVSWGLKTFPEGQDNECQAGSVTSAIDVPIAAANAAVVVNQVSQTLPEGDGTPTAAAIDAAVAYLTSRGPDRQQFILLATDGQPSCSRAFEKSGDDARKDAISAAGRAFEAGFPVFVVGVLDSDASDSVRGTLNDMATAGGKPRSTGDEKFYLASSQVELTAALTEITGEVASCIFAFESAPPDPTNIAVKIDGTRVERDPARANGWDYTNDAHVGVELFGPACERVESGNQNSIDIIFGCPGVVIR